MNDQKQRKWDKLSHSERRIYAQLVLAGVTFFRRQQYPSMWGVWYNGKSWGDYRSLPVAVRRVNREFDLIQRVLGDNDDRG